MFRRTTLAFVSALALPAIALAHGPSRKKEIITIEINAPVEKVWSVVGNYADMSWHSDIAKSEATGGNQPEVAARKLTFKSGAIFTDKLLDYDDAGKLIGFMTDIEDLKTLPVEGYTSTLTVKDAGGKSLVEWKGAFYRGYMNNNPPPELSDDAAIKAVSAYQRRGLDSLKAKLEGGG